MSIGPHTTPSTEAPGSLEERVNDVYRALALIHAACQAVDEDIILMDADTVTHAISQLALNAASVLEPLRHAPGKIGNWKPEAEPAKGRR